MTCLELYWGCRQMVECLPGVQKGLGLILSTGKLGMVVYTWNPSSRESEAGEDEFKVILGYVSSFL